IAEKVTALKIGKNVRLFFTVEQMPIICKNQRDYDAKHGLGGQVFPEVSGDAGRTLDVVAQTAYSGFFADGGGEEALKRIVKYGEPAQARIYVMPNKKDAEKTDDYEYAVSLIENLKGEDTVCVDKEPQTPDDAEGIISMKIDTEAFDKEKHAEIAGNDFLPRIFYFELYRKNKKDKEYEKKPVYTYPEEYGINRRNDSNIIELKDDSAGAGEADKANEEKLKKHRNYFLQLKVAKETLLNRSLSNTAPVVIGEPLERKEGNNGDGVWHDPVENPQINKYEYYGSIKPQSACFGNTRKDKTRFHAGIDLFAIPETTKVYACLDCKFVSFGSCSIILEIIDTKQLIEQKNKINYELQYAKEKEFEAGISMEKYTGKEAEFILKETDKIYLFYTHLYQQLTKKEIVDENGIVKAGTHIGYAGVEGNADKTKAPHLHFEVRNMTMKSNGTYRLNPALFIKLNDYNNNNEQENAQKQEWRDKAHK
ncbi:MAG: peptidoglycan DD-metalloendopeptidase family protein, partial [Prevotellaceae bacterium]|nr:peptidoglycan DD-metalloendopeptidase family protein [Prevotellaceae bacterium]